LTPSVSGSVPGVGRGTFADRAAWIVGAITALVCLSVLAAGAPPESWAHGSLLPIGLVLVVLAWEASSVSSPHSRWSVLIWSAFPTLMVLAVAFSGSGFLALAAGALVLLSVAVSFSSRIVDSRIATPSAVRIVAVALIAERMIPFDFDQMRSALAGTILGVLGGAVLVASFSIGRTVLPSQAVFGFLVATFAPDQPISAALFPFMAASVVLLNRRRDLVMLAVTVVLTILCGRWSYPLVVIPLIATVAGRVLARRRHGQSALIPAWLPWNFSTAPLARVLPLFPNALASIPRDLVFLVSAAGLLVLSTIARPAVAAMYMLIVAGSALAFARPHSEKLAFVSMVIAAVLILFLGWSGAFGSLAFFPLPLPWVPVLIAIAICLLPILFGTRWITAIAAAALCVFGAGYGHRALSEVHVVARALRSGESLAVDSGSARSRVAVLAFALNGAALDPESTLGTIEFLDDTGKGFRRSFRVCDAPDWGSFRRSIAFYSRNSWPSRPAGKISGVGPAAFMSGAGLVEGRLPNGRRIRLIRVTADPGLPPGTSLQIQEVHFSSESGSLPEKKIRS